jgi:hypothetical protein
MIPTVALPHRKAEATPDRFRAKLIIKILESLYLELTHKNFTGIYMKVYLEINNRDNAPDNEIAIIYLLGDMVKYKTMWLLRDLEKEINDEGGQIIAAISNSAPATFKLNGFSAELDSKISSILNSADFRTGQKI